MLRESPFCRYVWKNSTLFSNLQKFIKLKSTGKNNRKLLDMVIMCIQLNTVLLGKSLPELQSAHHAHTNVSSVFVLIIHVVPTEATLSLFSSLLAFRINDEFNKISTYLASGDCLFVSNCDQCVGAHTKDIVFRIEKLGKNGVMQFSLSVDQRWRCYG